MCVSCSPIPFMVNALEAGTIVAVLAAVVGWYMVLRRQAFAGHTLSVMAFPGAAGAALAGLPTGLGYYLACGGAALFMRRARGSARAQRGYGTETATIATVQVVGLAAGYLFLSLDNAVLGGTETLLFGTFLGVSRGKVLALLIVAVVALALVAVSARPLLLETIDPEAAGARGLPGGSPRHRLHPGARRRGGGDKSDHGRAARVALLVAPPTRRNRSPCARASGLC